MNNVTKQVVGVVAAVAIFTMLGSVSYLARIGWSQTFDPGNTPSAANQPRRSTGNNAYTEPSNSGDQEPVPEGEGLWEDYSEESLDYEPRLGDRPGNMEVLTKTGQFWQAMYEVEPAYDDVAFPLNWNGKMFESLDAWDADPSARASKAIKSGDKLKNKLREYNLVLHRLSFVDMKQGESTIENAEELGRIEKKLDRLTECRKVHPERAVLVLQRLGLESLQSDKIEADETDSDFILLWVKKDDGWKLVWFEK